MIRLAPIFDNEEINVEYLKDNYIVPFFDSFPFSFVEKGETLMIEHYEVFINDCKPKCGVIDK